LYAYPYQGKSYILPYDAVKLFGRIFFYIPGDSMKRNYQLKSDINLSNLDFLKQIAYHEAGHAAAIYLCNKQKKLPPVHFQISFEKPDDLLDNLFETRPMLNDGYVAAVEGGRLINNLPITLIESANYFSADVQDTYQTAFEADMINLLVGPLAEAKYVALRDNECFGRDLINAEALHFYGGSSDLARVYEYLQNFIPNKEKHAEKINWLLNQAYTFISTPRYWRAIENLATHITMTNQKNLISCEEAIFVLEQSQVELRKVV
jgi:hypothetical protein